MRASSRPTPAGGRAARVAFGAAIVVQLVVLYWPWGVSPPGGLPWDKVAHVAIFAAVAWTGRWAGVPTRQLLAALLVHAVASEAVQGQFYPARSGEPGDSLADAAGAIGASWWPEAVGATRSAGPPGKHDSPPEGMMSG